MLAILEHIVGKVARLFNLGRPQDQDLEEGTASYYKGGFHPVIPGELYNSKYKVLRKLGYGQYSTVWLVRNVHTNDYWAMKVLSAECYGAEGGRDIFELEILQALRRDGSDHPGAECITMLEDHFEHIGPNGRHACLIFKVMGESLASFRRWFRELEIPRPLVQKFTHQLVTALSCAHSCGIIHTDIQPGNIMMRNPDDSRLLAYLAEKYPADSPDVTPLPEHKVIRSEPLRNRYFDWSGNLLDLNVALADWGVASWKDKHLTEWIQPPLLRAPEVILHAPWNEAVDMWNLGALVPELIYGQIMFTAGDPRRYHDGAHLAEINALLGPFPPQLVEAARLTKIQATFDANGNVLEPKLKNVVSLSERFDDIPGEEGPKLEEFIRSLLSIDPAARPTPDAALSMSWLTHTYTESVSVEPS